MIVPVVPFRVNVAAALLEPGPSEGVGRNLAQFYWSSRDNYDDDDDEGYEETEATTKLFISSIYYCRDDNDSDDEKTSFYTANLISTTVKLLFNYRGQA